MYMTTDANDLCGGPGGWAEALAALGLTDFGIDRDQACVTTRRRAGHAALLADVAALNPADFAGPPGLIASPPCQLFSDAGSRHGVTVTDTLTAAVLELARGHDVRRDVRATIADTLTDDDDHTGYLFADLSPARGRAERDAAASAMVLEPIRWAHALRPEWIALEQVPAVLPVWQATAGALAELGYDAATAVLNAADYGVPQHRRRAILVAHRAAPARLPEPTHGPGLLPWVSIAEALGWDADPAVTVGFQRRDDTGAGGYRSRDLWAVTAPAPTVTEKARSWSINTGRDWEPGGTRADAQTVPATRPAPTFTAKAGGQWVWQADDGGTRRLELDHALILQGFRPDYPVYGTRTDQFRQVGDAVPPPLARAIVGALTEAPGIQ